MNTTHEFSGTQEFCGVILAAGKGTRAAPLSHHFIKPLLPVGNRPIIAHQLEEMARLGVRQVIIVVGHLKEQILRYVEMADLYGLDVRCIEQAERLGIAHAVLELEHELHQPFILFLGDIFLVTRDMESMLQAFRQHGRGVAMAARWETNTQFLGRNFLIDADGDGMVHRVIEKPQNCAQGLKGCGVYVFDESIFDTIRRTPRSAQRNEYEITDAIQTEIDDGYPVTAHAVVEWDMNVTFARDILECNLYYLKHSGLDTLVAPDAQVHPSARIEHSVVGSGSQIGANAVVQDSLVFDHGVVPAGTSLRQQILTPHGVLDFAQSLDAPLS